MPSLTQLAEFLGQLAPVETAESWDNVGTLVRCGDTVQGVLCALDITPAVVDEASALGCNVIVAHHPVIFRPFKTLAKEDVPARLVRAEISAICMHTNMDKAAGGVNDLLAALLGLQETQLSADGIGRVGTLPKAMTPEEFTRFVSRTLHAPVKYAGHCESVRRVALVGGDGGEFVRTAAAQGVDCFVTGEAGYHDALDARAMGVLLVAATHFATEYGIAQMMAQHIQTQYPELLVRCSTTEADPFTYIM